METTAPELRLPGKIIPDANEAARLKLLANALEFFARVFGIDRRDSYWLLAHYEPSRWHGVEAKGDA